MRKTFLFCIILWSSTSLGGIPFFIPNVCRSIADSPEYPPGGAAYDTWQTSPRSIYIPYGINGGYFPFSPNIPAKPSLSQRVGVLQQFYHKLLLSKEFNSAAIAKKYRKLFPTEMIKEIITLPSDSVGCSIYNGWGIFLGKGVKPGTFCDVQYIGENWYKAGIPDDDESNVYIKMELMGKNFLPIVTTVYNPLYNIIIGNQTEQ